VNLAGRGDLEAIKKLLLQGEDADAADYTGCYHISIETLQQIHTRSVQVALHFMLLPPTVMSQSSSC
jgi:hypothetical protein